MKTAIIAAVLVSSSLLCGCHSRPDASPPALSAQSTQLKTHAELTGYEEISRYAEVKGHHEVKLAGEFKNEAVTFPAGTILVRTAQPLGTLAAYLLEPESDDGLTTWNFLDSYLERGKTYPIYKLMPNQSIPPTITRHSSGGAASFGP
jgi:hypothetical protein